jgi:hypothetical protein
MIFEVKDPDDVARFLAFCNLETAHLLNGINGRNERIFWCEGYDSPIG